MLLLLDPGYNFQLQSSPSSTSGDENVQQKKNTNKRLMKNLGLSCGFIDTIDGSLTISVT